VSGRAARAGGGRRLRGAAAAARRGGRRAHAHAAPAARRRRTAPRDAVREPAAARRAAQRRRAFLMALRQRSVVMSSVSVMTPRIGLMGTRSMPTMTLDSGMYLCATWRRAAAAQRRARVGARVR
jgi:hypothetical protein